MKRVLLPILLLLCAGGKTVYPPILSHNAADWSMYSASLVPYQDGNAVSFNFTERPDTSCGDTSSCSPVAGYLYSKKVPAKISGSLTATFRVDVTSGNPAFQFYTEPFNTGSTPASVRFLLWSHNQNLKDGHRWWSWSVSYVLAPGTITLTVPLDPTQWSGVNGELASDNLVWWNAALNDVSSLGLTLGGGYFYGHGVYTTGGQAKFTLIDYQVIP